MTQQERKIRIYQLERRSSLLFCAIIPVFALTLFLPLILIPWIPILKDALSGQDSFIGLALCSLISAGIVIAYRCKYVREREELVREYQYYEITGGH